ncbi:MAG TPA: hypothetical protein VG452_10150, partial [Egibacteraceae bacterium]|nr:hypothetical protein [Egibacteraceae bacterium]
MADNPLAAWLNAGEAEQPLASGSMPAGDRAEAAVTSPLPADDAPGAGDGRRRRWWGLAVVATVPWVMVTALALGPGGTHPPPMPPAAGGPGDGPSAATPSEDPSASLAPPVRVSPADADAPSGPQATPGAPAAAGVLAVRRALGGQSGQSGQSGQGGDGPSGVAVRYVDLAVPEAVVQVGDVAVVTVAAVVLD